MSHRRRRWLRKSSRHRPAFGLEWPLREIEMGEATGGEGSIWLSCFIPHVPGCMNGRDVDPRSADGRNPAIKYRIAPADPHRLRFTPRTPNAVSGSQPASQSIRIHVHCHPTQICILSSAVGVISIPWHQPNSSDAPRVPPIHPSSCSFVRLNSRETHTWSLGCSPAFRSSFMRSVRSPYTPSRSS